ncbi:hypothetical protein [Streptomyces sp. NPDC102360]|uniref:hypothetical protein n=1 Tax=Streptomyces sp. NPDC102360 TaxID=3366160 RepID=UPI0038064B24
MPAHENTQRTLSRTRAAGRLPSGADTLTVVFTQPLPGTASTRSVVRATVVGRMWIAETPGSFERVVHQVPGGYVTRSLV